MKKLLLSLTVLCAAFQLNAQTAALAQVEVTNTTSTDKYVTIVAMTSSCTIASSVTYYVPASPIPTIIPGPLNPGVRYQYVKVSESAAGAAAGYYLEIIGVSSGVLANTPPFCGPTSSLADCAAGVLDSGALFEACWSNIDNVTASEIMINH